MDSEEEGRIFTLPWPIMICQCLCLDLIIARAWVLDTQSPGAATQPVEEETVKPNSWLNVF